MKIKIKQLFGNYFGQFQNAIKVAIAVILVYLVTAYLGATSTEQAWAVLTVFVVMDIRVGATVYASFYRAVGTLAGGLIAILLLLLLPVHEEWAVIVGLLIIGIVCAKIIEKKITLRIVGATAALIFILGIQQPDLWHLSLMRLFYTLLSIFIAFLVSLLFLPQHASEILAKKISLLLHKNGEVLANIVRSYLEGKTLAVDAKKDLIIIRDQLSNAHQLLNEMKLELWRGANSKLALWFGSFIDSQGNIYHSLTAMVQIVERNNGKEIPHYLEPGFLSLLEKIQKTFADLSLYIYDQTVMFEKRVLTDAIENIEAQLTIARKEKIFSAYANDTLLGLFAFLLNLEMIANELITVKKTAIKLYPLNKKI